MSLPQRTAPVRTPACGSAFPQCRRWHSRAIKNVRAFPLGTGILCACLAARKNLCYCAFFESDGKTVTRLTEDSILEAGDIAAQIEHYSEPVMVIGDGAAVLRESCESFTEAPMHLRDQSACGIAMAAMHTDPVLPEALTVSYLQAVKIG